MSAPGACGESNSCWSLPQPIVEVLISAWKREKRQPIEKEPSLSIVDQQ